MNNSLRLWRWPWHRLSKCQSLSTTLLFWMIIFHLLNLKILIKIYASHPNPTFFKNFNCKIVNCNLFTHEALGNSYELAETSPCVGSSLEVLEERGKPEYPEKNLSEQGRESTTNSTHIWRQLRDLNQGQIGGRASALTTVPSLILLPKHIFLILGVSTETFSTKGNLANIQKRGVMNFQICK